MFSCPKCQAATRVIDSRPDEDRRQITRRRRCGDAATASRPMRAPTTSRTSGRTSARPRLGTSCARALRPGPSASAGAIPDGM
ncbi:NrdR family transcriptional regulator [Methylobacterium soli]